MTRIRKIILITIPVMILAGIIGLFIFRKKQLNPVTGRTQAISLTPEQEVAVGIEYAPQLAKDFGGLYRNRQAQEKIKHIGRKLIASSQASNTHYQFDFHILADSGSVNILALPGGQIFITQGLFKKLKTDDALAAVLSHEIGHVMGRHASEKVFKTNFLQTIGGVDSVSGIHDATETVARNLSNFKALHYTDEDEMEADDLSIPFMVKAGFDPNVFFDVFQITDHQSDFLVNHPVTTRRVEKMKKSIQKFKH